MTAASRLLDEVIADTFRERLNVYRTSRAITEEALIGQLHKASMDISHNLRRLESPNYHSPPVAFLYLLRYHFSHVNLAWSMLSASPLRQHAAMSDRVDRLQIIDFGAGNFAGLLGLALFLSELIADGIQPPKSSVVSFEPAKAMRCTGASTWIKFQEKAVDKSRDDYAVLGPLRNALQLIEHEVDSLALGPRAGPDPDAHRCLIAMHVFYNNEQHRSSIKQELGRLRQTFQPHSSFVSCHQRLELDTKEAMPHPSDYQPLHTNRKIEGNASLPHIRSATNEWGVSDDSRTTLNSYFSPVWNRRTSVLYLPDDH